MSLNGLNVLITRPAQQAQGLCDLIESAGGRCIRFPLLAIEPSPYCIKAVEIIGGLNSGDWIIFVSTNAVTFAARAVGGQLKLSQGVRVAAIGNATALALRQACVNVDLLPEGRFNSETLLSSPEMNNVSRCACVIVRGEGGRDLLAETLRTRGARVMHAVVYRRIEPQADVLEFVEGWKQKNIDVVTMTSGEALRNLVKKAGRGVESVKSTPMVVISNRLRGEAIKLGFKTVVVSKQAADQAIVKTLHSIKVK